MSPKSAGVPVRAWHELECLVTSGSEQLLTEVLHVHFQMRMA